MCKKGFYSIVILLLLLCCVGCQNNLLSEQIHYLSYNEDEQDSTYNTIQIDNQSIDDFSVPIDDITELINDKVIGLVYFGRDTCPLCSVFNSAIKEVLDHCEIELQSFITN